jgi:flagellar protein FlgJ
MSNAIPQNANVYTELSSLKALKGQVKSGDQDAIEKVAKQFEAIFLQMMLSGMRKTIQVDDEYSNDKAMYYDLFDKQVAMNLSEKGGIGLARLMMGQVNPAQQKVENKPSGSLPVSAINQVSQSLPAVPSIETRTAIVKQQSRLENTKPSSQVQTQEKVQYQELRFESPIQFVKQLWEIARDVVKESGLDPKAVIAQAALETGWGKHIIRNNNGQSSFNLFGIKSGQDWNGDHVKANTLEFRDGVMMQSKENFRSYRTLKDSVEDYVSFIKNNQRYRQAVEQRGNPAGYATELQRAGYATDPDYASKIISIMNGKEFTQFFSSLDV